VQEVAASTPFPLPLADYPTIAGGLLDTLSARLAIEPFNAIATAIFVMAILHTLSASWFARLAHRVQRRHDASCRQDGRPRTPSVLAESLHFLGEVEVVFGLWAAVLLVALVAGKGWRVASHYLNDEVNYTEPMFVVVIMTLASTRPIVTVAESWLGRLARVGGCTPGAWWLSILTIGPLLGSFITEPAAMTICALLLSRQFFDLNPSPRLKYATLGLLFVNVSIGGTLTHFAAPPVLIVARPWGWDTAFMLGHFGWRAASAIAIGTSMYYLIFRREFAALARSASAPDAFQPSDDVSPGGFKLLPVPPWVTLAHALFIAWTVLTAHEPALFVGGFLFFLGFAKATGAFQSQIELRSPLLVGFFLAGLVIHGGLQGWWIAPVLSGLSARPLFFSATVLTAFNDNALITYLATLVPSLDESLKIAVVAGAVTGGGLTVIANAPNPAGQAILSRFFGGAISPAQLFLGALIPTLIACVIFIAI
jgi:hypothetical protein